MGYPNRELPKNLSANENERPITRRERAGVFMAGLVGGAVGGGGVTLFVIEHLPLEISGSDLAYAVGAGAAAGAAIAGEEAIRATKGFKIPIKR